MRLAHGLAHVHDKNGGFFSAMALGNHTGESGPVVSGRVVDRSVRSTVRLTEPAGDELALQGAVQ